jgi:flagellar basal-body rod modification protein FlgD
MEITSAASSQAQSASLLAGQDLAENFDNFLMLLVAQLQNQDPLSPMDTNEFTSQLVSFASVEQEIATNTNLEQMIALQRTNQTAYSVGYLGKRIEAAGDTTVLQNGQAEWNYSLPEIAQSVTLAITDSSGNTVQTLQGATDMGAHQIVWNGLDANGNPVPAGEYTLNITAMDSNGDKITTAMTVVGKVSGIEATGDLVTLFMGSIGIPVDQVISVLDAPPVATEGA